MKHLVEKVRKAEIMFGVVEKKIQQCEKDLKNGVVPLQITLSTSWY